MRKIALVSALVIAMLIIGIGGFTGFLFCATTFTGLIWCKLVWNGIMAIKNGSATPKKTLVWILMVVFVIPGCWLFLGLSWLTALFI